MPIQRARAAEPVGDVPEDRAADPRHHQRGRAEHARRVVTEAEVGAQLSDGHGVEHEIHGVEHPAELRRQQDAPLFARDGAVPRNRNGGGRSHRR
jgi:hypothetical protein